MLGNMWEVKGNIFKCKFKGSGEGSPEGEEGTVLFLRKVRLTDDSNACEETCRCACHETSSDDVLRDVADALDESWESSLLEADGSQGTGPLAVGVVVKGQVRSLYGTLLTTYGRVISREESEVQSQN